MKASIILLIVLCGATTAVVRNHTFVDIRMNWTDALSYCRQHYEDLSTITSEEEQQRLLALQGGSLSSHTWIGLHRDMMNLENFLWSDGDSFSFSKWGAGQPNNFGGKQYCMATEHRWGDEDCYWPLPFYCQKTIILIKEKMTWEEALEYCRENNNDLFSLTFEGQLQLLKRETVESQTDSVWTGLRFQAGEWFWVNGKPLLNQTSFPVCPVQPIRCGARNTKTDEWETRDCGEKLNFICS